MRFPVLSISVDLINTKTHTRAFILAKESIGRDGSTFHHPFSPPKGYKSLFCFFHFVSFSSVCGAVSYFRCGSLCLLGTCRHYSSFSFCEELHTIQPITDIINYYLFYRFFIPFFFRDWISRLIMTFDKYQWRTRHLRNSYTFYFLLFWTKVLWWSYRKRANVCTRHVFVL